MSSATSTERRGHAETETQKAGAGCVQPVALLRAAVAARRDRGGGAGAASTPEHLILISLTIGAAGARRRWRCYRMLAPLVPPRPTALRQPLSERLRADLEREKTLRSARSRNSSSIARWARCRRRTSTRWRRRLRAARRWRLFDAARTTGPVRRTASGIETRTAGAARCNGRADTRQRSSRRLAWHLRLRHDERCRRGVLQALRHEAAVGARVADTVHRACSHARLLGGGGQRAADARSEEDFGGAAAGRRRANRHRDRSRDSWQLSNALPGQTVELSGAGSPRTATTDEAGRARSRGSLRARA